MLFLFFIATIYQSYASPVPLGPEVFSSTPFTLLFARSTPCNCGPQERTLYDLIRGCVLTIFACVYTSLHPNIPDPKATDRQKLIARLQMVLYMLIIPEAVIWWAMRQRYGARSMLKAVNELQPDLEWTLTHAHFVQMGGLEGVFPDGHREVVIPVGITASRNWDWRWDPRVDPNELRIPKKQLEDRSKGDFLSKGIAVLQTSWFVLECFARLAGGLSITKLELMTLAFGFINVMTYIFWWHKPLNVNCQVEIHMKDADAETVRQFLKDQVWDSGDEANEDTDIGEGVELTARGGDDRGEAEGGHTGGEGEDENENENENENETPISSSIAGHTHGYMHGILQHLVVRPYLAVVLPIRDMFMCLEFENGATHVPRFYAWNGPLREFHIFGAKTVFGMIAFTFGVLHFAATPFHFTTHIEFLLWCISSSLLMAIPFVMEVFWWSCGYDYWQITWNYKHDPLVKYTAMVLYTLGPLFYILARLTLIVLAFFSLRDLSPKVFETVAWTSYIPHL